MDIYDPRQFNLQTFQALVDTAFEVCALIESTGDRDIPRYLSGDKFPTRKALKQLAYYMGVEWTFFLKELDYDPAKFNPYRLELALAVRGWEADEFTEEFAVPNVRRYVDGLEVPDFRTAVYMAYILQFPVRFFNAQGERPNPAYPVFVEWNKE